MDASQWTKDEVDTFRRNWDVEPDAIVWNGTPGGVTWIRPGIRKLINAHYHD